MDTEGSRAIGGATDGTTQAGVADDAALVAVPGATPVADLGEAAAALGAAPVVPVPVGGPGVGAERIAEPVLGTETRPLYPRTADPRGPVAADPRYGAAPYRAPAAAPLVVDPDGVPGTHIFEALTRITHDGRDYVLGDEVELDFRSYEELVSIGAVRPIDWSTGEPIRLAPAPGAPRY